MFGAAFGLGCERLGDEGFEKGFELGENRCDVGSAAAGIKLLHQRVIGSEFENLGAELGFLASNSNDAFKGGREILSSFRQDEGSRQSCSERTLAETWRRTKSDERQVRLM